MKKPSKRNKIRLPRLPEENLEMNLKISGTVRQALTFLGQINENRNNLKSISTFNQEREEYRSYCVEIVDSLLHHNPLFRNLSSPPKPTILLDSANFEKGLNLPKSFCQGDLFLKWTKHWPADHSKHVTKSLQTLSPHEPDYWEQWDEVVRDALLIDAAGVHWHLEQDGEDSLWAVPTERRGDLA